MKITGSLLYFGSGTNIVVFSLIYPSADAVIVAVPGFNAFTVTVVSVDDMIFTMLELLEENCTLL